MPDTTRKLTVSFGAFSCTLAGFEDPFPIMKQVVDYFQALAARDPGFGAHPERPSTDALRAIAEARTGSAVEAEMNGDEVVLRHVAVVPEPQATQEQTATEEPAPQITAEDPSDSEPHRDFATETAPVEAEAQAPAPIETEPSVADLIAAADRHVVETTEPTAVPHQPELVDRDSLWEAFQDPASRDTAYEDSAAPAFEDDTEVADAEPLALGAEAASLCAPSLRFEDEEAASFEDQPEEPVEPDMVALAASVWTPPATVRLSQEELETERDAAALAAAAHHVCETALSEMADRTTEVSGPQSASQPAALDEWMTEFAAETPDAALIDAPQAEDTTLVEVAQAQEDSALDRILSVLRMRRSAAPDVPPPPPLARADQPERSVQPPLKLGFGDQAGLDATHDARTETADFRKQEEERAFGAILGEANGRDADFDYADPAPASEPAAAQPLVLTAMHRVEAPAAPQNPIAMAATAPESADLRRFAARVGAASVTDLIEASAAFVTLVNGRPSFSRREVLGMLDELAEDQPLTQEARIKSFGSLLRVGRFKRSDNGEFALTNEALSQYEDRRSA